MYNSLVAMLLCALRPVMGVDRELRRSAQLCTLMLATGVLSDTAYAMWWRGSVADTGHVIGHAEALVLTWGIVALYHVVERGRHRWIR